jgi:hypothetical protein
MLIVRCVPVVVVVCVLLTAQVEAGVVSFTPSHDNTLYSENGDLSNGAGAFTFSGRTALSSNRRTLLAFDVAKHVPPGSTITSATLTLHVSQSPGLTQPDPSKPSALPEPFVLHRVTAAWGEGTSNAGPPGGFGAPATIHDSTWTFRFWNADAWRTPGGDFNAGGSASVVIPVTSDAFVAWGSTAAMVADVQDWLDNPATNFGWVLIGNETADKTARRFDSRESPTTAHRPVLTIDFIPPIGGPSR